MKRTIFLPPWKRDPLTAKKPHIQRTEIVVCGIDSETHQGPPISLQFHSYDDPAFTRIYQVDAKNATETFFKHLRWKCDRGKHYRVYGHYLEFDMVSFFWPMRFLLIGNSGAFEFTHKGWHIQGVYGRPTFARITSDEDHYIELIDSSLWFRGSLDNAAAQYCPDLRKLDRPANLGEQWFSVRNSEFAAYAMRDAEIAARLGRLVEDFHIRMELRPSVSLAAQAAQIFRTRYIDKPIQPTPGKYLDPAINAYHGGKNNLIPHAAPAWHENAAMYDISSAYPWAMTELPDFADADEFHEASLPAKIRQVPTPGIYCVTGKLAQCKWPIFFSHDFKPLRACEVEDLWIHGYELNEALAAGEFKPTARIKGCYYNDRTKGESATARFSRDFYKNKSEATNPIDRYMYKILLNCLSGKFIQTREQDMQQEDGSILKQHVAGGLFHPFIAGAITAHTRAKMHRVEHMYGAYHTATDGIIAPIQREQNPAGLPTAGLGSLNEEMRGNVIILRTKLYIAYSETEGAASKVFSNWKIAKYALHGFQGKVSELEEMIMSGRRWYIAPHKIGLREAHKHHTTPNQFVNRQLSLQVGPLIVQKYQEQQTQTQKQAQAQISIW